MIDYTTRRKGVKAGNGRTIAACPKCGRKGAYIRYPKEAFWSCIHTAENIGIGQAARDHCSGKVAPLPADGTPGPKSLSDLFRI